jgi:hypothetical protein
VTIQPIAVLVNNKEAAQQSVDNAATFERVVRDQRLVRTRAAFPSHSPL